MRIFLAAVDLVPAAIVLVPLFLILFCTVYERNVRKSALYCLFCLYMATVFSLVGIPNVTYFRPEVNLNLIPFLGIVEDLKNSVLNVALFVPLGFLLPMLWRRFRQMRSAVIFGAGLSLTVELLQLLTFRATDVNDLITNSFGTAIGFLLAKGIGGKFEPAQAKSGDVYVLCVLSFAVMFFLHPILSPILWDRIL